MRCILVYWAIDVVFITNLKSSRLPTFSGTQTLNGTPLEDTTGIQTNSVQHAGTETRRSTACCVARPSGAGSTIMESRARMKTGSTRGQLAQICTAEAASFVFLSNRDLFMAPRMLLHLFVGEKQCHLQSVRGLLLMSASTSFGTFQLWRHVPDVLREGLTLFSKC